MNPLKAPTRGPLRPPLRMPAPPRRDDRVRPIRLNRQAVLELDREMAEECSEARTIDLDRFTAQERALLKARARGSTRRSAIFDLGWSSREVERVWKRLHRKLCQLRNDAWKPSATSRSLLIRERIAGRVTFTPALCADFLDVMSREWPQPVQSIGDKKCLKQLSPNAEFEHTRVGEKNGSSRP